MNEADMLNVILPASPVVDALRFLTMMLGFWVFCAGLHRFLTHRMYETAIAAMAAGAFTAVQNLAAIGDQFYPWRLPLLVVLNVSLAIYLYRGRDRGAVVRDDTA